MKRRLLTIILVLLIALSLPIQVLAQDYYFSLDALTVDVYWNSDGASSLDYYLTFTDQPSGHSIEFVDVGIPNGSFDVASIKADIDGTTNESTNSIMLNKLEEVIIQLKSISDKLSSPAASKASEVEEVMYSSDLLKSFTIKPKV